LTADVLKRALCLSIWLPVCEVRHFPVLQILPPLEHVLLSIPPGHVPPGHLSYSFHSPKTFLHVDEETL